MACCSAVLHKGGVALTQLLDLHHIDRVVYSRGSHAESPSVTADM